MINSLFRIIGLCAILALGTYSASAVQKKATVTPDDDRSCKTSENVKIAINLRDIGGNTVDAAKNAYDTVIAKIATDIEQADVSGFSLASSQYDIIYNERSRLGDTYQLTGIVTYISASSHQATALMQMLQDDGHRVKLRVNTKVKCGK